MVRRFASGMAVASAAVVLAAVGSGCGEQESLAPDDNSSIEVREGALATLPWSLVGPMGYWTGGTTSIYFTGTVAEAKTFPADSGSGGPVATRLAAISGGIFEDCNCRTGEWINLTQSLVPTHTPRIPGEGLAASTFISNPADNYQTILFGTAGPISQGTQQASGIWKGTKSGSAWTWTNPLKETSVFSVHRLIWGGGGSTTRVHAATDTGYWRSDNAGGTWTQFNTGCTGSLQLTDIADYHGQYLLAVGKCSSDTAWNLWKLAPNQNWARVHALTANAGYAWLTVGPTTAYILIGRTDDTGVVERYNGSTYFSSTTAIPALGGQMGRGYNGAIAVDPNSDSTVYAAGQFMARNTTSGTGTWTGTAVTHPDFHHFFFTRQAGTWSMLASSDGGITTTSQYSSANPVWNPYSVLPPISHVGAIDVTTWNGQTQVYASTWDSGLARGIDDGSRGLSSDWQLAAGGDGGMVTLDPGNPGVAWATIGLFNPGFMSTDNFQTQNVSLNASGEFVHDQVPQVFLYNFDFGSKIKLATAPQQVPVVWTDYATLPASDCCWSAFGVGRYNGGSYLYMSAQNLGGIWVAPPGSTTFTQTSAPNVRFTKIHGWVSSDSTAWQTAYAIGPSTVLRTRTGGQTWRNITGDLPSTFGLEDIVADPGNPDIVFVSVSYGGNGIYKTTNASTTTPHWTRWVAGLPAGGSFAASALPESGSAGTQISILDLGAGNRWLYAGFWGGSVWKRRTDATD